MIVPSPPVLFDMKNKHFILQLPSTPLPPGRYEVRYTMGWDGQKVVHWEDTQLSNLCTANVVQTVPEEKPFDFNIMRDLDFYLGCALIATFFICGLVTYWVTPEVKVDKNIKTEKRYKS